MEKQLRRRKRLSTLFYSLCLMVICANVGWGQTTIFVDAFATRATVSPGGTPTMTYATASTATTSGTATVSSNRLNIAAAGAAGRTYVTGTLSTFSSPYNVTLSSNIGLITWTFNMRTNRSTALGTIETSSSVVPAVILVADNASLTGASTKGYAVALTGGVTGNKVELYSFTSGLLATAPTTVLSSTGGIADMVFQSYVSVKVTYDPVSNTWSMFVRDDGLTAAADPAAGSYTSTIASVVNTANTSVEMSHFGYFMNHSTTTNIDSFDNFKVVVDPPIVVTSFFYYKGTGDLSAVNNWGSNPDGTGSAPSNFTNASQIFTIRNTTNVSTTTPWTVSGANSKIVVGDPTVPAVTLTIASGSPITGTVDVPAALSASNSLILQDLSVPTFGTINVTSEVHFNAPIDVTFTNTVFGKLIIDAPPGPSVTFRGTPIIQANGSFTVMEGSSLFFSGSSAYYITINSGGSVAINGTVRIQKIAGFVNSNVTPGTSFGSIQFTGSENLTLGANSLISYDKSANATTYNITARSYVNLSISGAGNPKAFLGTTTVSGKLTIDIADSILTTLTALTPLTILSGGSLINTSGTLNAGTGGYLTLKSAAIVAPVTGSISGNVIVERNIPAGFRAYRLLSSPVSTLSSSIKTNWQESGTGNLHPGYGTHITGAGGAANGFDATTTNASSLFTHNNTTPAWTAAVDTNGDLIAGSPYLIYIRGSRQATNIDGSLTNDATILRATGTLATGTVAVSGLNATTDGFSLVGNPYQAQVDMQTVLATASNLNTNYYYVLNPKLGTKGQYEAVDVVTPGNNLSDANKYLQPWQACFVKTTADGVASLSFTEANKSNAVIQTSVFRTRNAPSHLRLSLYDSATLAQNGNPVDRLLVAFDANENNSVNENDAVKLTNLDENFATANSNKLLCIEKRTISTDSDEIPLNITKYKGTSYTIKAEGALLTGPSPYLLDQYVNKTTEIPQDGSVDYAYTIDAAIPASMAADRFKIIYAKTLKTIDNEAVSVIALFPNPSKTKSFNLAVPQGMSDLEVTVSNVLGQKIYFQKGFQSGTTVKISPSNVHTSGVYLVSLSSDGKTTTTKWIVE